MELHQTYPWPRGRVGVVDNSPGYARWTGLRFHGAKMGNLHFKYRPHWYDSPVGKQLTEAITVQLNAALPAIFGFYLLQLGRADYTAWLAASPILRKIIISTSPATITSSDYSHLYAPFQKLPFPDNSIDAIVLPCTLETVKEPALILEELWRVLLPSGTLILIGLNPWSTWGLAHLFLKNSTEFPWQGHCWSQHKTKKWLTDAQFSIENTDYFHFLPPLPSLCWQEKLRPLEKTGAYCYHPFGGFYQITATKQVAPLVPLKPKWKVTLAGNHLVGTTSQP